MTCRILFSFREPPWYPRRRSWSSEPWSRRSRCHPLNGCSTATQKVFQLCKCRIVHRRLMLVSKSSWQRWATPPSSQVPLTSHRCRHPKHRRRCRRHRCSPRKTPVHHACTNRSPKLAYLRSHSAVACFVCPIHQLTAYSPPVGKPRSEQKRFLRARAPPQAGVHNCQFRNSTIRINAGTL